MTADPVFTLLGISVWKILLYLFPLSWIISLMCFKSIEDILPKKLKWKFMAFKSSLFPIMNIIFALCLLIIVVDIGINPIKKGIYKKVFEEWEENTEGNNKEEENDE